MDYEAWLLALRHDFILRQILPDYQRKIRESQPSNLPHNVHHFFQNPVQGMADFPVEIMAFQFAQVANVTKMVASARLVGVGVIDFLADERFDLLDALQY
jgi:hypothetical protein